MKARSLRLVQAEEQLSGKGPIEFERWARTSETHGRTHSGLLAICATVARRAARSCVVPSFQPVLLEALSLLQHHLTLGPNERPSHLLALSQARAKCFQSAPALEEATAQAVAAADAPTEAITVLDHHAAHVIDRYTRLSAHHACAATCHALDAAASPADALEVLEDTRGAHAYQLTALGAARQRALRAAAVDQAQWEKNRLRSPLSQDALTLQIFHEYLGGRYRAYVEQERAIQTYFIDWALSGAPSSLG